MRLSRIERWFARLGWGRLEGKMPQIKRWGPVIGAAVLAVSVVLRVFGLDQAAQSLESLGGVVGLTQQSPVGIGELTAAAAALSGIALKIRSEVHKARAAR